MLNLRVAKRLVSAPARVASLRFLSTSAPAAAAVDNTSPFVNARDLHFVASELFDCDSLLRIPRYTQHDKESMSNIINSAVDLATNEFYPLYQSGDRVWPTYDKEKDVVVHAKGQAEAVHKYIESGFAGLIFDNEHNGLQLPLHIAAIARVPFLAANVGLGGTYFDLSQGVGNLIRVCGSKEQADKWIPQLISGESFGTMCLSETQAGSSLAEVACRATRASDGTYRLRGSKMWISGGDQAFSKNIIHMVLARLPDAPAGVRGISLFLVPKFMDDGTRNDVYVGQLQHKMGAHAATNCEMLFGDRTSDGAVGYLIGKEHEGLKNMFNMMNEARIFVGATACGSGIAGYQYSLQYARDRRQGRHASNKDPKTPMVPIIEHADVKRMLLAQKSYAEGGLALCTLGAYFQDLLEHAESSGGSEGTHDELESLLELMIPVIKSWPSEWCLEANKWAIQVLGGYGFTKDYLAEQIYRDNRINMIYEGTNGIQSIDLLGRKITMNGGLGYKVLATKIAADVASGLASSNATVKHVAEQVKVGVQRHQETTAALLAGTKGNASALLANSHEYLNFTGHTIVSWVWLKQALAAERGLGKAGVSSADAAFYQGKLFTARYFVDHELVKTVSMAELLRKNPQTNVEMQNNFF